MYVARNHFHSRAPAIEGALQDAIANVRSDSAREDWVLCGFKGGDDIQLIGTGVGGIEALKLNIVQWDVCYGLVRCTHTLEQAGYVQTDFIKFVWVYWRPDNIPVIRKMKIGVNEGEMKSLFAPYHAELQACTMQELGEQPLADVLDNVTMRADRTRTKKLQRSPSSPTLLARGRNAWKLARSSLPAIHFAHLAIADEQKKVATSTKVEFDKPEAFAKAIKAVRSDISFADWCLVGYKNDNQLRMVGTGKGGLEALLDAAEPYGANYGLLRVSEKFDLVYHEAYCFITWIPENIPAFAKARVSTHQVTIIINVHASTGDDDVFLAGLVGMPAGRGHHRAVAVPGGGGAGGRDGRGRQSNSLVSPSSVEAASITRPVYIAPKTKTKSLRGSVVIKADMLKKADSPSEEEKSEFPRMFLNSLSKNSIGGSTKSTEKKFGSRGVDGGETKAMEDLAEAKARDSPIQHQPPTPATSSVLTSVQEAVRRVRMGGDGADFVVVEWRQQGAPAEGGSKQKEQLEIKEIGSGGVQALADCLEKNSVMYGLVRVTETTKGANGSSVDGVGGSSNKEKFCCVKWAPEDGPAEQRTPELQGEVSRLFHPYHGDLTAKHAGDVTPEAVSSRIASRLKQ
ncbi:unnamed protein product [Hapterophycus canaliculatus]